MIINMNSINLSLSLYIYIYIDVSNHMNITYIYIYIYIHTHTHTHHIRPTASTASGTRTWPRRPPRTRRWPLILILLYYIILHYNHILNDMIYTNDIILYYTNNIMLCYIILYLLTNVIVHYIILYVSSNNYSPYGDAEVAARCRELERLL